MAKDSLHVYTPIEAVNAATALNAKWNILTSQEVTTSSGTHNIDVSNYNQLLVTNKGFGFNFSFRNDIANSLQVHNSMYTNRSDSAISYGIYFTFRNDTSVNTTNHNSMYTARSDSGTGSGVVPLIVPKNTKYFSFRHNGHSGGNTKVFVVGY